jgi:RNA polymerase-binding transcription factor DksA
VPEEERVITHEEAKALLEERRRSLTSLSDRRDDPGERLTETAANRSQADDDLAAEVGGRETEASVDELIDTHVHDIDRALERVAQGTWGTCSVCGEAIDDERLRARPETDTCRQHGEAS